MEEEVIDGSTGVDPRSLPEGELTGATPLEIPSQGASQLLRGRVDFYAELLDEDGAILMREPLFELDAGEVLFHLPTLPGLRWIALGRGRVTLEPVSLEELTPHHVDGWLSGLCGVLERAFPSIDLVQHNLAPGDDPFEADAGEHLSSYADITWARFEGSALSYQDQVTITPGGGWVFFPLSPRTWLVPASTVQIEPLALDEPRLMAAMPKAMEHFHEVVVELMKASLVSAFRLEQRRLTRRQRLTEREKMGVLTRFSTVIDGGTEWDLDAAASPLLRVCQRIGQQLGVNVEPPSTTLDVPRGVAAQVEAISRRSRLRARQVVLRDGWWRRETRPMLAFRRDSGKPVALLPWRRGQVLWDPVKAVQLANHGGQRLKKIDADTALDIDPVAYSFYRVLPDRPLGTFDLATFAFTFCRRDTVTALLCSACGVAMAMMVPIAMGWIIDVTIPAHQVPQLFSIALALMIATFASFSFKVCEDIALLRFEGRLAETLQPAILDRLLRMPNTFFRRYSAGDLAERVKAIETVETRLSEGLMSALFGGLLSLLNFVLLFYIAPRAAAIAALLVVVLVAAFLITARRQQKFWLRIHRLEGQLASMILQMVHGMHRVRLAGSEDRMFVRWGNLSMKFRDVLNSCYNSEMRFGVFSKSFQVLCFAILFGVMATITRDGLSTGRFLAFIAAFSMVLTGLSEMAKTVISSMEVVPTFARLHPILDAVPESDLERAHPGVISGRVEINDVMFRYGEGMRWVLQGLSMSIKVGQSVAIVGPSGCGKSTLLRLILGFERPTAGSIYFDRKDLAGLDLREVRHQIGVVLQNDQLMEASLFQNIRGDKDISMEEAWRAAQMSGIADDIEAMPLGMHTVVSAKGSDLSGGQVQRLLIARALASRPRILLLDEATSALDNHTQSVVTDSLDRLRVTRITIAHRLSTVKNVDRIFVLDGGQVVEEGTYENLMASQGFFAELVHRQLQ